MDHTLEKKLRVGSDLLPAYTSEEKYDPMDLTHQERLVEIGEIISCIQRLGSEAEPVAYQRYFERLAILYRQIAVDQTEGYLHRAQEVKILTAFSS